MARKINPNLYLPMTRHEIDVELKRRSGAQDVSDLDRKYIEDLAAGPDIASKMLAARYRGVDITTLGFIALNVNPNVRAAVASNTSVTPALLNLVLIVEGSRRGLMYRLRNGAARTALFNAVCNAPAASLDTLERLINLAGKDSPAGRYARERIRLAATKVEMDARRARLKAEKEAAVA